VCTYHAAPQYFPPSLFHPSIPELPTRVSPSACRDLSPPIFPHVFMVKRRLLTSSRILSPISFGGLFFNSPPLRGQAIPLAVYVREHKTTFSPFTLLFQLCPPYLVPFLGSHEISILFHWLPPPPPHPPPIIVGIYCFFYCESQMAFIRSIRVFNTRRILCPFDTFFFF